MLSTESLECCVTLGDKNSTILTQMPFLGIKAEVVIACNSWKEGPNVQLTEHACREATDYSRLN